MRVASTLGGVRSPPKAFIMKIAFYKAEYGDCWDKLVALWTWGPYSHCELVFSDGECFSASPRDGGTRFKNIEFVPERWDFLEIPVRDEEEIREWCRTQEGRKYDWLGILGFILTIRRLEDRDKWYCSEICFHALSKFNSSIPRTRYRRFDPNRLYKFFGGRGS